MLKTIEQDGVVTKMITNTKFNIELESGHEIVAIISGKLKMSDTRIVPGDKVKIEFNTNNLNNGKIVFRYR